MTNNSWSLYVHTNKLNGKQYVGITSKKPNERWCNGKAYIHDKTYFGNAINKYGWCNFEHEIIYDACLTEEEAKLKEKEYIKKLNTKRPYGYNLTDGGEGVLGWTPSEDTKKIWRKQRKNKYIGENNPMFGKHHSLEAREKIRVAHMKLSPDIKLKYKKSMKELWSDPEYKIKQLKLMQEGLKNRTEPIVRPKLSEKHKEILSKARKEKCSGENNPKATSVWCIELHKKFNTIKSAGEYFGKDYTTYGKIGECCKGKRNTCMGYHWMYYNDYLKSTEGEILEIKKKPNNTKGLNNGRAKTVYCKELDKIWFSAKDAADELGINPQGIRNCCRGKISKYKKYHFEYLRKVGA